MMRLIKMILRNEKKSTLDSKYTKRFTTKLHKSACWVARKIINEDNLSL